MYNKPTFLELTYKDKEFTNRKVHVRFDQIILFGADKYGGTLITLSKDIDYDDGPSLIVIETVDEILEMITGPPEISGGWLPIETAPRDGTYVLLAGPSGYITTPLRAHVGRWGTTYKENRWITHSNDDFTDDGEEPTLWMPLP